ncbi:hypothetical protein ACIA5A_11165 [Micromonospora sp. NPDC051300]|uniref:hypothetical protein n=1 Tax=Micromonospora sp. NPDC051300 TaxID=3364286 RepID=UPI00379D170B
MTDLRLVVAAGALAAVAAAGAVAVWRRRPRPGVALRAGVVLLAELLLVTAVALVVNRAEGFYPTWRALAQNGSTARRTPDTPGRLDATVRRLALGADRPVAMPWRPPSLAAWPGAGVTVQVPAGYLGHPSWRYPAVLVLSSPVDGWTDGRVLTAARQDAPAVVVVTVRAGPDVDPGVLATRMPQDLERDLRVTGHRWGLVASGHVRRLAQAVVGRDPGRFPVLAITAGPRPSGLAAGLRSVGGELPAPLAAPAPVLAPSAAPARRHPAGHHTPPTRAPVSGIGLRRGS